MPVALKSGHKAHRLSETTDDTQRLKVWKTSWVPTLLQAYAFRLGYQLAGSFLQSGWLGQARTTADCNMPVLAAGRPAAGCSAGMGVSNCGGISVNLGAGG